MTSLPLLREFVDYNDCLFVAFGSPTRIAEMPDSLRYDFLQLHETHYRIVAIANLTEHVGREEAFPDVEWLALWRHFERARFAVDAERCRLECE
jgi:hypothetical protein